MSSSREESPDWLRSFQAPTQSVLTLSSDSESPPSGSPSREDGFDDEEPPPRKSSKIQEKDKNQGIILGQSGAGSPSKKTSKAMSPKKRQKVEDKKPREKKNTDKKKKREGDDRKVAKKETSEKHIEPHEPNHSIWPLSSDSEMGHDNSPKREDDMHNGESSDHKTSKLQGAGEGDAVVGVGSGESPSKKASKEKSPRKRLKKVDDHTTMKEEKINENMERKDNGAGDGDDVEVAKEETSDKYIEPHVSSSMLPLMLSEKVQRSKALVECEGDSIDMSGDMGSVGRIVVSDTPSGNHEMYLDLKGTIYKTTIVPSRTFCVVSFGQSEAKIEAIMNDFIQLKPQSNVYEAETMIEGTLDGYSFDSEDEAEKMPKAISHQTDQNEGVEEQTNGKSRGKAEKKSGVVRKRGKTAGGKSQPPKKVRKKNQVSKKAKNKK